jgi:hypothetical protein
MMRPTLMAPMYLLFPLTLLACGDKAGGFDSGATVTEDCTDGVDNDGNGAADCADAACADDPACAEDDDDEGGDSGGTGGNTDYPDVLVNEFMASNSTTLQDVTGAWPDWIELYNASDETVDLAGWFITDNLDNQDKSELPSFVLEPGDFLVLYADDDQEDGDDHVNFSLNAAGEQIGVYGPDGSMVDEIEYGEQATDVSMGRVPDGSSTWEVLDSASPGSSNE